MKAKGKGHVSFPDRCLFQPALALQGASAAPRLNALKWGCKCVLSVYLINIRMLGLNIVSHINRCKLPGMFCKRIVGHFSLMYKHPTKRSQLLRHA